MPLPSVPGAKLTVAVPPVTGGTADRRSSPAAAGAAGLGLILLIVGAVTGKKREASAGSTVPGIAVGTQPRGQAMSQPAFGTAQTEMSASSHAVGTPSPIGQSGDDASYSSANLGPGAMIGRWEIIKRLGSGGMADVYLARARGEAGFEKLVAVKVMHPHLARNERAVEHFLDEARLPSRISHPNVVADPGPRQDRQRLRHRHGVRRRRRSRAAARVRARRAAPGADRRRPRHPVPDLRRPQRRAQVDDRPTARR